MSGRADYARVGSAVIGQVDLPAFARKVRFANVKDSSQATTERQESDRSASLASLAIADFVVVEVG
jgi:hypothetical protein